MQTGRLTQPASGFVRFGTIYTAYNGSVDIMRKAIFIGLSSLLAAQPLAAAESGDGDFSVYRLNSGQAAAHSRLQAEPSAYGYRGKPAVPARFADQPYAALIQEAAREVALDPALVHALISVESGYDPSARSPKGAIGLMQVLPETAARYGVSDPGRSPEANLRAGTRYLSDLMRQFGGRLELVLAAYNAGENAVLGHGWQIPPYRETRHYVPAVLAKYREWGGSPLSPRIDYLPGTRRGDSGGLR